MTQYVQIDRREFEEHLLTGEMMLIVNLKFMNVYDPLQMNIARLIQYIKHPASFFYRVLEVDDGDDGEDLDE